MKIFTSTQIHELDKYTIENEPVSSIGLMERAADRLMQQFRKNWSLNTEIVIFAGPGNNGGDGLALGRMMLQVGYEVQVILLHTGKLSAECRQNKERLQEYFPDNISEQTSRFLPPETNREAVIIDALFGSGLSKPIEGIYRDAVEWINKQPNNVVAIDIPSGLPGEACMSVADCVVGADFTYSLQFPKLSFLLPENEKFVGKWNLIDIQLYPKGIEKTETGMIYLDKTDIQQVLKARSRFSNKGNFGHTLIWAGKKGMAGAAVLVSKAALRSGAGLVSVHSDEMNRIILQTTAPEAIFKTELDNIEAYNAFAFGPGLGTDSHTTEMFTELLKSLPGPCVLDADALNIIALQPHLIDYIPVDSVLTPHPKEFERLFGKSVNSLERIRLAREKSRELNVVIVLKGANTLIATPDGKLYFNSTGNPGMASGGMGDVLTGIIAGLMAQGYSSADSSILGVYLHGLSADQALFYQSEESLLASDVIAQLGSAFKLLRT